MDKAMTLEELAREERNAYHREYRRKNRKRINEYHRKWREDNPDKVRAANERYWENKVKERQAN